MKKTALEIQTAVAHYALASDKIWVSAGARYIRGDIREIMGLERYRDEKDDGVTDSRIRSAIDRLLATGELTDKGYRRSRSMANPARALDEKRQERAEWNAELREKHGSKGQMRAKIEAATKRVLALIENEKLDEVELLRVLSDVKDAEKEATPRG